MPPPPDAPADAGGHYGKPRYKGKEGEIFIDAAGKRWRSYTYVRGDRTIHPWYEVDESGSRIMSGSVRPPDTPARIWSKMTDYQQQADALDYSLGRPGRAKGSGGDVSTASGTSSPPPLPPLASGPEAQAPAAALAPMGLYGLFGRAAALSPVAAASGSGGMKAKRGMEEQPGLEDYCIPDLEHAPAPSQQALPWDAWDAHIDAVERDVEVQAEAYKKATAAFNRQLAGVIAEGLTGSGGCAPSDSHVTSAAVRASGGVIAAVARSRGSAKRRLIPALPTVPYNAERRHKIGRRLPIPACVAKPREPQDPAQQPFGPSGHGC